MRAINITEPGGARSRTMFHDGERAVQRRAGAEQFAARVGRGIVPWIRPEYAEFLSQQPFVVVAGQDAKERVWASLIVGGTGFARAVDDRRLLLAGALPARDPLAAMFDLPGGRIGILAIEPHTRSRIRLNGAAERTREGILVTVDEAFGNCRRFISRRVPAEPITPPRPGRHRSGTVLDARQVGLIRAADTFFIASTHPERGADASHRGGRPGFVEAPAGGGSLRFPDYQGNRMFQTLGNLTVAPGVGLLFVDWQSGAALQLTGRARIVWDEQEVKTRPGAERLVDVEIDAVHQHQRAMPARWSPILPSRPNPPVSTE